MAHRSVHLHDGRSGAALAVRVTPRAGQDRVAEVLSDGTVKIHLTAAPVDGEANTRLIEFLAKVLGVRKSDIEIVAGATSRNKLVSILGIDTATLQKRIASGLR